MYRHTTIIKSFVFVTVVTLALGFLSTQVFAENEPTIRSAETTDESIEIVDGFYQSEIITTAYPFDVAGFAWQGAPEYLSFKFRLYDAQGWSKWYQHESDSYIEKDGWYYSPEPFLADSATKIEYRLTAYGTVDRVKLIYIETAQKPSVDINLFEWLFKKTSAASSLTVIPRSGWDANEDWRFNSKGEERWEPEIVSSEKIIVHHTAGNPGNNDPEGTIQGIYYWHAVVLGWGDIGYNYLIDQQGNIYEGRAGGDGVVAGHAYRSATCAATRFGGAENEAGFNRGTIGIAILGDYETSLTLNSAVKNALTTLIGHKAALFGIDPTGSGFFTDDVYDNVLGHSDVDCTNCPGKNLYSQLSSIRSEAKTIFNSQGGIVGQTQYDFAAAMDSQQILPATFTGDTQTVVTTIKNVGNEEWSRGQVTLTVYDLGDAISRFYDTSWPQSNGNFNFDEKVVQPGEIATFTFTMRSPNELGRYLNIYRISGPADMVQQDDRSITRIDSRYQATLASHNIPPALLYLWRPSITVRFKNTGLATWDRHVTLEAIDLGGAVSRFKDSGWLSNTTTTRLDQTNVKPGETGSFTFRMRPPTPGLYLNSFYIQRWGEDIQNGTFSLVTRVD